MKIIKYLFFTVAIIIIFLSARFTILPFVDKTLSAIINPPVKSGYEFKTKEECEKNKGDWGKAGIFPKEFCRIPTDDFGKECSSGFECKTGKCLARFDFRGSSPFGKGLCPKYVTVFGCIQEVHFGVKGKGICLD